MGSGKEGSGVGSREARGAARAVPAYACSRRGCPSRRSCASIVVSPRMVLERGVFVDMAHYIDDHEVAIT